MYKNKTYINTSNSLRLSFTLNIYHQTRSKLTNMPFDRLHKLLLHELGGVFAPYKLQALTEAVPANLNECPVCFREYGKAEDDEDKPCRALQAPCGHYIGSECAENMVIRGMDLPCPRCFNAIPRDGKPMEDRLGAVAKYPPFSHSLSLIQAVASHFFDEDLVLEPFDLEGEDENLESYFLTLFILSIAGNLRALNTVFKVWGIALIQDGIRGYLRGPTEV